MRKDDKYIEAVLGLLEREEVPNTRSLKLIITELKKSHREPKITEKNLKIT